MFNALYVLCFSFIISLLNTMVIALHCKKYADEIRVLSGITNVEQNRAEYIVRRKNNTSRIRIC